MCILLGGKYSNTIKKNKSDGPDFTTMANRIVARLKLKHPHLSGLHFDQKDTKKKQSIYIILENSDIAKINSCKLFH